MNIIFKGKVAIEGHGYKIGQIVQGNGYVKGSDEFSWISKYNKNEDTLQFIVVYTNSVTQEIIFSDKKKISKIKAKFNSNFTKSDLVTGDVILRRNGSVGVVCLPTGTIITPKGFNFLDNINEDLTSHIDDSNYDVIAVRRPIEPYHCQFYAFKQKLGDLVYERE